MIFNYNFTTTSSACVHTKKNLTTTTNTGQQFDATLAYRDNDGAVSSDDEAFLECRSFTSSRSGIDSNSTTPRQLTPTNNFIEDLNGQIAPLPSFIETPAEAQPTAVTDTDSITTTSANVIAASELINDKTFDQTTPNTSYVISDQIGSPKTVAFESEHNLTEVENKENSRSAIEGVASTIEALLEQVTSIATAVATPRTPLAELPIEEFAKESAHSVSRCMKFDEVEPKLGAETDLQDPLPLETEENPLETQEFAEVENKLNEEPENIPFPDQNGDGFDDLTSIGSAQLSLSQELAQFEAEIKFYSNENNAEINQEELNQELESLTESFKVSTPIVEAEQPIVKEEELKQQPERRESDNQIIPDSLESSTITNSGFRKDSLTSSYNQTVEQSESDDPNKTEVLNTTETFEVIESVNDLALELPVITSPFTPEVLAVDNKPNLESTTPNSTSVEKIEAPVEPTLALTNSATEVQQISQTQQPQPEAVPEVAPDAALTDSLEMPESKGVPMDVDYDDGTFLNQKEFSPPKDLFSDRISNFNTNENGSGEDVFERHDLNAVQPPTTFVQEINTVNLDTMFKKPAMPIAMKKRRSDQTGNLVGDIGEFQSSEGCKKTFYLFIFNFFL